MSKRILLVLATLLVFAFSVAAFAYSQTSTGGKAAVSCCCKGDSCTKDCCDKDDCCGDSCPMKKQKNAAVSRS
jgi:hypothetical protein